MKKMKLDIQRFNSTNKTTHYNLSQYMANDKPTYLVDYNDDMVAIDTAIYEAKTQADLGVNNASVAQTTAENAQTTANTAVTNAGTAQTTADDNSTKIGDLANLTTANKTNLVSAISEVNNKTPQMMDTYTSSTTDGYCANYINQIIESGTDYIKYYDGTMICWGSYTGSFTITKQSGGVYYTTSDFTFPQTFISTPVVIPSLHQVGGVYWCSLGNTSTETTSGTQIRILSMVSQSNVTLTPSYVAIGKWK